MSEFDDAVRAAYDRMPQWRRDQFDDAVRAAYDRMPQWRRDDAVRAAYDRMPQWRRDEFDACMRDAVAGIQHVCEVMERWSAAGVDAAEKFANGEGE